MAAPNEEIGVLRNGKKQPASTSAHDINLCGYMRLGAEYSVGQKSDYFRFLTILARLCVQEYTIYRRR